MVYDSTEGSHFAGTRERLSGGKGVLHAGCNASWRCHTINQDVLLDGPSRMVRQVVEHILGYAMLPQQLLERCSCMLWVASRILSEATKKGWGTRVLQAMQSESN